MKLLRRMVREMHRRNYAMSIIKIYGDRIRKLIEFAGDDFDSREVLSEFIVCFRSGESQLHAYNAIKFLYRHVLKKPCPLLLTKGSIKKDRPG